MGEGGYSAEMFTGLVEELGRLEWLRRGEGEAQLAVHAPGISPGVRLGDSIAVNGCCLTVTVAQGKETIKAVLRNDQ